MPHTLDRPQIVRHGSGERLELNGLERWGAPLDEMVLGTLVDDLAERLPSATVYAESGAISVSPDVLVEVELSRFEQSNVGSVDLVAQVAVRWINPAGTARLSHARLAAPSSASNTTAVVSDLSTLLGQLSDSIAQQIGAGPGPTAPP